MNETPVEIFADFAATELTFGEDSRRVYTAGCGPAVIVMTEMPGITPDVVRFARWVRDAGFTVWLPSLFGVDGALPSLQYAGETMGSACVRREFLAFANNEPSPMVHWLRQLAVHAHNECGGSGVGTIGMCFTGNFALAMTIEPAVIAAVMSQPSLPLDDPSGTFIHAADMNAIRARLDQDERTVLAYRFEGDAYCRAARFETLERALGDRIETKVLDDSSAGEWGWTGTPHSVVTTCLIDEAGEATAQARDDILTYFATHLHADA